MYNIFAVLGEEKQAATCFILQKRQVEALERIGERLEKIGKEVNNATTIMSEMVESLDKIGKEIETK